MSAKESGKFMASLVLAITLCLLLMSGGCSDSSNDGGSGGKLVNYVLTKEYTAQEVAEAIKSGYSNIPGYDVSEMIATSNAVTAYSIEYYTKNINGELIIVSGLVAFPSPADGVYPVVQYHHATQFNDQDVPSNPDRSSEAIGCLAVFAGHGYITSLPDYIGQGKSKVKHPYLHVKSEATSCADMLKAVNELCAELGVRNNSKLFILGLSQGGQATLAVQKYLETNNSEQPFNLTASTPIAGVYDVPKQWDFFFTNPPICVPLAAHITMSYRYIYGFMDTLSELFLHPYDSQILSIDDGKHNAHEMDELLPKTMEGLFHPNFINEVNAKTHPFYEAMKDNIIDNFAPITPTRLYIGKDDEIVPYSNSVDSCNKMKALGAVNIEVVDVGSGYSHAEAYVPSVIRAKFWFDTF